MSSLPTISRAACICPSSAGLQGYFAGEDAFYRTLSSNPAFAAFCPAYSGTRTYDGREYVVLEDLTHGMQRPLVVDIKLGTCTVAPDAPWTKRMTHLAKDRASTTRSLGIRIVGAQTALCTPVDGAPVRLGKSWGKALRPEDMSAALRTCFSANGQLCTAAIAEFIPRLRQLALVLEGEPRWQLVSSSLLFVFQADAKSATEGTEAVSAGLEDHDHAVEMPSSPSSLGTRCPSMRVIDFAHAYPLRCSRDAGVRRLDLDHERTPPCVLSAPSALAPLELRSTMTVCVRAVCSSRAGDQYLYGLTNLIRALEELMQTNYHTLPSTRILPPSGPVTTCNDAAARNTASVTEHPIGLVLSEGEVGCSLGEDGAVPPEACAAASANYVR